MWEGPVPSEIALIFGSNEEGQTVATRDHALGRGPEATTLWIARALDSRLDGDREEGLGPVGGWWGRRCRPL